MPFLVQLKAPTYPKALLRDGGTMRSLHHDAAVVFDALPAFAHEDRTLMVQAISDEQAQTMRAHNGKVVIRQVAQYTIEFLPPVAAVPVSPIVTLPPPASPLPKTSKPKAVDPAAFQRRMDIARKRL